MGGEPVQIYRHLNEHKRDLDVAAIRSILSPHCMDEQIAILSLNGLSRDGKSFLLSFIIKYIQKNGTQPGNMEWLNEGIGGDSDTGFKWKGGIKPVTAGMWMWSEPFRIETPNGKPIYLILMDCQGSFDEETSFHDNALLFCISVWLSSLFIYNVKGKLSEEKLHFLEYFSDFAAQFAEDQNTEAPIYQTLMFLLRDWPFSQDYPYGFYDGATGISGVNFVRDKIIGEKVKGQEAINSRQSIMSHFTKTIAYLLPSPGLGFDRGELNTANAANLDPDFSKHLPPLMNLLVGRLIEPKMIMGEVMTGRVLLGYVERWSSAIRNQEIPPAKNLNESTAEMFLMMAARRVEKLYQARAFELARLGHDTKKFIDQFEKLKTEALADLQGQAQKAGNCRRYPNLIDNNLAQLKQNMETNQGYFIQISESIRQTQLLEKDIENCTTKAKQTEDQLQDIRNKFQQQEAEFNKHKTASEEEKIRYGNILQGLRENIATLETAHAEEKRRKEELERERQQYVNTQQTAQQHIVQGGRIKVPWYHRVAGIAGAAVSVVGAVSKCCVM